LGVSEFTFSNWELGRNRVPSDTLLDMLRLEARILKRDSEESKLVGPGGSAGRMHNDGVPENPTILAETDPMTVPAEPRRA